MAERKVLVLVLLLYLPFIFLGYGSDVDTFRVLDAGRNFLATADYVPSRRPGYLVFEMAVYALDQVGGSLLVNLGTLFWGLAAIDSFLRICRRHVLANSGLLAAILAVHPLFLYNATVSIDYIWAVSMLLIGFDLLERDRFEWAGLALGLSIGCRFSSVIVAAALFAYAFLCQPAKRGQIFVSGLLSILIAALAYLLPWDFAEWRPSFWVVSAGAAELWTPEMLIGRFLYKNLYFWGIPAGLCLFFLLWGAIRGIRQHKEPGALGLAGLCSVVILLSEILFLRFPIETEYLLPTLPFWLLLLGMGVRSTRLLRIFLVCVLMYNFININLARPDQPGQASQASFGIWVEPGYFLQELSMRWKLISCDTHACYDAVIGQRPDLETPDH